MISKYHSPEVDPVYRFLMVIMMTNEEFVSSSKIQVRANHMAAHGSMLNLTILWAIVDFTLTRVTVTVLALLTLPSSANI